MRTFIAIRLPDQLRSEIGRFTEQLREYFPGLRWVKPENMHLTLRFLGEIDPGVLAELEGAVAGAAELFEPFELEVNTVGHFGSQRRPRVLWLGLKESKELTSLAESVENALVERGFGRADKPFKAHLTLARMKKTSALAPDWKAVRENLPPTWPSWPVQEVEIIESTLTPRGPIYETLAHCPLKGSSGRNEKKD